LAKNIYRLIAICGCAKLRLVASFIARDERGFQSQCNTMSCNRTLETPSTLPRKSLGRSAMDRRIFR
jgi:hypothetical protein